MKLRPKVDLIWWQANYVVFYNLLQKHISANKKAITVFQGFYVNSLWISEVAFKTHVGYDAVLLKLAFTLHLEDPVARAYMNST